MQNAICIVWLLNHLIQETKLLVQEMHLKQNILHVKISKVLGYCIVCINVI